MKISIIIPSLIALVFITSCMPNTYYSITDDYAYGLRWFDRGQYDNAERYWKPLAESGDVDAQFQYGWMLFLNHLSSDRVLEGLDWIEKSANQGQTKALAVLGDLYHQSETNGLFTVKNPKNLPFTKDPYKAYVCYKKGLKVLSYKTEKGYLLNKIAILEKELEKDEVSKGNIEANNWQPVYILKPPRKWW